MSSLGPGLIIRDGDILGALDGNLLGVRLCIDVGS